MIQYYNTTGWLRVSVMETEIVLKKCLSGLVAFPLQKCFTRISHSKNTRGNNVNLNQPKVKTEVGRKRFTYQGTIIFNKLPNALKTKQPLLRFRNTCKSVNLDF